MHQLILNNDAGKAMAELSAAKGIAEELERRYPGWAWMVEVDVEQGILKVWSLRIPGRWGFLLHLSKLDPEGKAVMRAGGELLERYNMRRGKHQAGATLGTERDAQGRMVPQT